MPSRVRDMDFDEVSTVDVPANQHGLIVLAKAATPEETVDFFDEDGQAVDISALSEGDYVYDADGDVAGQIAFEELDDEGDAYDGADQRELAEVGKSAFFEATAKTGDAFFAQLSSDLTKAVDDQARQGLMAKALAGITTELAKANQRASAAEELAKALADERLTEQYISKAAEYNVPVAPEVLGPVLKRMAESMSYEDCSVVAQLLDTSGDIFKSFGLDGEADNSDPYGVIEDYANDAALAELGKAANGSISPEEALVKALNADPRAYTNMKRAARRNG